jgi:CBS domain containing-hemolysin-like protein
MSKTFAVLHSDRVALTLAPVVYWLSRILYWPTRVLIAIANILLPGKGLREGPFVSEEDIRAMAEAGSEEGAIEEEEKELIHSIFEFGDTVVREVMTPLPDVKALDQNASTEEFLDLVIRQGLSRIPIYNEHISDITGVVYAKDVLREVRRGDGKDKQLKDVARKAVFTPESKKVNDLLKDMQKEKFHLVLVVDEYGSLVGLVTLEDLLEEIVGEIEDEYDLPDESLERLDERRIRVDGTFPIDDFNERFEVAMPDDDYHTLAGFVFGQLGRAPKAGDEVDWNGLRFGVIDVEGTRIEKLQVEFLPEEAESATAESA